MSDENKKIEKLIKELNKKRTVVFIKKLEENIKFEKKIRQGIEDYDNSIINGDEETKKLKEEEIKIYQESFGNNLFEMDILMNLIYQNDNTFQYN